MTISLDDFCAALEPHRTIILFGAGASIPSGAPTVSKLIAQYAEEFHIPPNDYTLSEITSFAEAKTSRNKVISVLRKFIADLSPTGGIKNLPLYNWKSLYSTNYDNLIEQVYLSRNKQLRVYDSNFSFNASSEDSDCVLFKIHGTIEKDLSNGFNSRIILTEGDYEETEPYREFLYDRLKGDLAGADLIIIGQSLADPDMKKIVNRAASLNAKIQHPARIYLLMYTCDENRASLFEERGIKVCFGGIDEFFAAMSRNQVDRAPAELISDDPFEKMIALGPVTIDVQHASEQQADISSMFNGSPASYSDIRAGYTFDRLAAEQIVEYFTSDSSLCATLLGASGVGKTTCARQALNMMRKADYRCWEHKGDHSLKADQWHSVAQNLMNDGLVGALFIDNAHHHLLELNNLIDALVQSDNAHLKLIIVSTRNHWYPRIKTPNIYKYGKNFSLSKLNNSEIDRLLLLLDESSAVRLLVEDQFSGFNKQERRRRLMVRCEADMFVCMKNIFANDSFDDIVLREFAELEQSLQGIYQYVAAMETAGIRVHRQLVIRILGIAAPQIKNALEMLTDIIYEYSIDEKLGIYGWRCRHSVISGIVTKYKFQDIGKFTTLLENVIINTSPTYDIEIRSLRELCNIETGISRIPNKDEQNRLLRMMMSNAPGERVPRHRLIRNLIDQGHFGKAETEIRIFDKDFRSDGPVHRYKIKLMIERATRTLDILEEDRIAILEQAYELAILGADRYPNNKNVLRVFAELGIEYYKRTNILTYYDEAIGKLQAAEENLGDPEISKIISRFNRRIAAGQYVGESDEDGGIAVID